MALDVQPTPEALDVEGGSVAGTVADTRNAHGPEVVHETRTTKDSAAEADVVPATGLEATTGGHGHGPPAQAATMKGGGNKFQEEVEEGSEATEAMLRNTGENVEDLEVDAEVSEDKLKAMLYLGEKIN